MTVHLVKRACRAIAIYSLKMGSLPIRSYGCRPGGSEPRDCAIGRAVLPCENYVCAQKRGVAIPCVRTEGGPCSTGDCGVVLGCERTVAHNVICRCETLYDIFMQRNDTRAVCLQCARTRHITIRAHTSACSACTNTRDPYTAHTHTHAHTHTCTTV